MKLLIALSFILLFITSFHEGYEMGIGGFIYTKEVVLTKGDQKIALIGIYHVASKSYYQKIQNKWDNKGFLELKEGVQDLSLENFSYTPISSIMGDEIIDQPHPLFDKTESIVADISAQEIPQLENILSQFLKIQEEFSQGNLLKYFELKNFFSNYQEELLKKRNTFLIETIKENSDKNLIIPWGVAHLPEIESFLETSGFKKEETSYYFAKNEWKIHFYYLKNAINKILK